MTYPNDKHSLCQINVQDIFTNESIGHERELNAQSSLKENDGNRCRKVVFIRTNEFEC